MGERETVGRPERDKHSSGSLPWALVASPSRDSDSRMVLQVEAISEMDCHSSSRVSLPASDITAR